MCLIGFELLAKVSSFDKEFVSGPPWEGKGEIVIACGYASEYQCRLIPLTEELHEAYEDARLFREIFSEELSETTEDPQELYLAFIYVREQTFFLQEVVEQLHIFGIDYIYELREEFWLQETERCTDPEDQVP